MGEKESGIAHTALMTDAKSTLLYEGDWLELRFRNDREYMVRKRASGIAIIVAVTNEGELLLTEQYRAAVDGQVLELPAGMAGDIAGQENESVATAAKRELLEETGYAAAHVEQVAEGPISSGFSNEVLTFFRAYGLTKHHEGGGEADENIIVHRVKPANIPQFIAHATAKGMHIDPKIFIGLYFLENNQ